MNKGKGLPNIPKEPMYLKEVFTLTEQEKKEWIEYFTKGEIKPPK